jgi:hypothetical protein
VDAVPCELVERVELPLPGTPVELMRPVGHEAPQPVQLGALLPAYAGHLIGPSRTAQPYPQIVEYPIRDMNPKRFHYKLLAMASRTPRAAGYFNTYVKSLYSIGANQPLASMSGKPTNRDSKAVVSSRVKVIGGQF